MRSLYPDCKHCSELGTCGTHYRELYPEKFSVTDIRAAKIARGKGTIRDYRWLALGDK